MCPWPGDPEHPWQQPPSERLRNVVVPTFASGHEPAQGPFPTRYCRAVPGEGASWRFLELHRPPLDERLDRLDLLGQLLQRGDFCRCLGASVRVGIETPCGNVERIDQVAKLGTVGAPLSKGAALSEGIAGTDGMAP